MRIFMFEKSSKRPREIVNVFRVTFVFPVQDHLYLIFISDRGSGLGIYWFGKPSLLFLSLNFPLPKLNKVYCIQNQVSFKRVFYSGQNCIRSFIISEITW